MNRFSRSVVAAAFALAGQQAHAQVAQEGQPLGLEQPFASSAPVLLVSAPDVDAYRAEDEARNHWPLRYGAVVDVAADLADGSWTTLADGTRVWRLEIFSPGALSLAVEFARFDLPRGARFYVYDGAVETWLGAYTRENRHKDGGFVFQPFPGERLTLELDVPAGAGEPVVQLRTVIHDYRGVLELMSGPSLTGGGSLGQNDQCLVDVNCPIGNPWALQKRAAVRTLSQGQTCSGALINNTANDGAQYVLTAQHCVTASDCVFYFNYQTPACGSGTAPTNQTVTGSTLLAANTQFDQRLVRIDNPIPAAWAPFYAGWNRTTTNPTYALTIGHPAGGPKKIAVDANGAVLQIILGESYWNVFWNEGYVQVGSSGGGLFDQDGRLRGPAVLAQFIEGSCDQFVWASRFDQFWAVTTIAQWLDPLATGATAIDGHDPYACGAVQNVCMTSPNSVGPGAVIDWSGAQSTTANLFHLNTSGCPPNTPGIYYYGSAQTLVPFGNGFRCIANPVVRTSPVFANAAGVASRHINLVGTQIDPGETWYFQFWYRNPAAGGAFFNLSDALSVPFCN